MLLQLEPRFFLKETFSFRCAHDLFDSKDGLSRAKAGTKLTQSSNRTERGIGILAKKLRKRFVSLEFKFISSLYISSSIFSTMAATPSWISWNCPSYMKAGVVTSLHKREINGDGN